MTHLSPVILLCALHALASHQDAFVPRINKVFFAQVDNMTLLPDSYSITYEEPFLDVFTKGPAFVVVAGRHGSRSVALAFSSDIEGTNVLPTSLFPLQGFRFLEVPSRWRFTEMPWLLNFVVFGNITFNIKGVLYKCLHMRIAQGSFWFSNNWWIGGPHCDRERALSGYDTLTCNCSSREIYFHHTGAAGFFYVSATNKSNPCDASGMLARCSLRQTVHQTLDKQFPIVVAFMVSFGAVVLASCLTSWVLKHRAEMKIPIENGYVFFA